MALDDLRAVGILGGTFNPPHIGHIALARYARAKLGLERVVLMPAKTVVYRQRYGAGGTITVEGRDKDKSLATVKLDVAPGKAPDLKPKMADLVVVPMPLRTVPHLQAAEATGAIAKTDVAISLIA